MPSTNTGRLNLLPPFSLQKPQALHSSAAVQVQLLRIQRTLLWAHGSRILQDIIRPSSLLGWEQAECHYFPCFCTACWEFRAISLSLPWCSEGLEAKCKVAVKGHSWVARGPAPMVASAHLDPHWSCPGRAGQPQVPARIYQMPFLLLLR